MHSWEAALLYATQVKWFHVADLSFSLSNPCRLEIYALLMTKYLVSMYCTHCTMHIHHVSEISITFLVTRPIHILKAGLWQSAFVLGDAVIRQAGLFKERLSGSHALLICGPHAWDVSFLSAWEILECLGAVVNKVCLWLCVCFDICVRIYSHNRRNSIDALR